MKKPDKGFGAQRIDLQLPLPLRRVFYKLLEGASWRDYAVPQRIALLLVEMQREIGIQGVKRIMKRLEKFEGAKK
jgi:hypothetical protein